jgi:hypothetical protein
VILEIASGYPKEMWSWMPRLSCTLTTVHNYWSFAKRLLNLKVKVDNR